MTKIKQNSQIVLSGVFDIGTRKEISSLLEKKDITVKEKISYETDILLIGSSYKKNKNLIYKKIQSVADKKCIILIADEAEQVLKNTIFGSKSSNIKTKKTPSYIPNINPVPTPKNK
jgi:hypothetical protein